MLLADIMARRDVYFRHALLRIYAVFHCCCRYADAAYWLMLAAAAWCRLLIIDFLLPLVYRHFAAAYYAVAFDIITMPYLLRYIICGLRVAAAGFSPALFAIFDCYAFDAAIDYFAYFAAIDAISPFIFAARHIIFFAMLIDA